ncbi:MAG: CarD family transcriptional regulator [Lachnospiraceae bacterium]|nr:CarD family transcriptional regulator [Lachnospiraceae bacterium]
MFEIGQYVNYGKQGVCKVEAITHMDMPGVDKDALYYVLSAVYKRDTKIYIPVDNHKVKMRGILSQTEAKELIADIPQIAPLAVKNDKSRKDAYKDALTTCDCKEWVRVIKSIHERKQYCKAEGKKVAVTDENFYREASDFLYGELAISLNIEKDKVEQYIINHVK